MIEFMEGKFANKEIKAIPFMRLVEELQHNRENQTAIFEAICNFMVKTVKDASGNSLYTGIEDITLEEFVAFQKYLEEVQQPLTRLKKK